MTLQVHFLSFKINSYIFYKYVLSGNPCINRWDSYNADSNNAERFPRRYNGVICSWKWRLKFKVMNYVSSFFTYSTCPMCGSCNLHIYSHTFSVSHIFICISIIVHLSYVFHVYYTFYSIHIFQVHHIFTDSTCYIIRTEFSYTFLHHCNYIATLYPHRFYNCSLIA